jgi:hypothetical protein
LFRTFHVRFCYVLFVLFVSLSAANAGG